MDFGLTWVGLVEGHHTPTRFSLHDVPRAFFDAFPSPGVLLGPTAEGWGKTIVADGVTLDLFTREPPKPKEG